MILVRPLADSDPTPTKRISQGQFEQGKGGLVEEKDPLHLFPENSSLHRAGSDNACRWLSLCQTLSWLVFSKRKVPSDLRFFFPLILWLPKKGALSQNSREVPCRAGNQPWWLLHSLWRWILYWVNRNYVYWFETDTNINPPLTEGLLD